MPSVGEDKEQLELSYTAAGALTGTVSLENHLIVSNKTNYNHLLSSTLSYIDRNAHRNVWYEHNAK